MGDTMFYKHVISNINNEDVLYLYLSNSYEFGMDLKDKKKHTFISNRVDNYIKNSGIKFQGNKIFLVTDGIIVGTITRKKESNNKLDESIILEKANGSLIKISMDHYLLCVMLGEILPNFDYELLKAQAVICRTYALKKMKEENKVKAINQNQIYHDLGYYKFLYLEHFENHIEKINRAIKETKGEYISFKGTPINPLFHLVSNGKTEILSCTGKKDEPYLKIVISEGDFLSPSYITTKTLTLEKIKKKLNLKDDIKNINILSCTKSNRIKQLKINNEIFDGYSFSNILNLPSQDFTVLIDNDKAFFTMRGFGHGIGLSQYGANEMAKNGYNYHEILKHYYNNVEIVK